MLKKQLYTILMHWMHELQKKISFLISLTSALFSIFFKHKYVNDSYKYENISF
jgi:hypothetical protein